MNDQVKSSVEQEKELAQFCIDIISETLENMDEDKEWLESVKEGYESKLQALNKPEVEKVESRKHLKQYLSDTNTLACREFEIMLQEEAYNLEAREMTPLEMVLLLLTYIVIILGGLSAGGIIFNFFK